jgi:hypothetical protein
MGDNRRWLAIADQMMPEDASCHQREKDYTMEMRGAQECGQWLNTLFGTSTGCDS